MDPARRRLRQVAATQVGRQGPTPHGHPVRSTETAAVATSPLIDTGRHPALRSVSAFGGRCSSAWV